MGALRRLALATATAALLGGPAGVVRAADSVTVEAHVEMVGPCIETSTPVVDFGRLQFGGSAVAPVAYQSCAIVSQHVYVRSTDATDGGATRTGWALDDSGAPCPDRGLNRFSLTTDSLLLIGTTDREIDEVPGGQAGAVRGLVLSAPCPGSDGLGAVMSWHVTFTATF